MNFYQIIRLVLWVALYSSLCFGQHEKKLIVGFYCPHCKAVNEFISEDENVSEPLKRHLQELAVINTPEFFSVRQKDEKTSIFLYVEDGEGFRAVTQFQWLPSKQEIKNRRDYAFLIFDNFRKRAKATQGNRERQRGLSVNCEKNHRKAKGSVREL